jgi:murein DD-endopeptidase MepM/ murein hydrolase activator NlpD
MVENGKKFTASQASDIKKYYNIDVPVDEKAAGEKVLSYSAPATESNPTDATATAPQPPAADTSGANPNPKALVKAISGSAGAGYETAKATVGKFVAPVAGRISSFFNPNRKHPVTGKVRPHKGVDFAVPVGTPVTAAGSGTVSLVNPNHKDFGQVAMISHPDGTSSLYAHNSQLLVTQGQKVEAGQQIALSGNTGLSSGPHVHFEMMKGNSMGSGQFDPGSTIPSLASGSTETGGAAPTMVASAASTVTPTSPEAPTASAQSPVPGSPVTSGSATAVAAATGSTPKPAAGGTNVATVPTYAYMDAKFFALNLSAIT